MVQVVNAEYWQQDKDAWRYLKRIRNERKREYAKSYLVYLRYGGLPPSAGDLSTMAAQGVRLQLESILKMDMCQHCGAYANRCNQDDDNGITRCAVSGAVIKS